MYTLGNWLRTIRITFSVLCLVLYLGACTGTPSVQPLMSATNNSSNEAATPAVGTATRLSATPSEATVLNLYRTFGLGNISSPRDYFVLANVEHTTERGLVYDRIVVILTQVGCDSQNRAWGKVNLYYPQGLNVAQRYLADRSIWLPGRKGVVLFSPAGLTGGRVPLAVTDIPAGVGLQFYLDENSFAKLLAATSEGVMVTAPRLYSLADLPIDRVTVTPPMAHSTKFHGN